MTQYSTGLNNTTSEFAYFTPLVKRVHAQADIIGPFLWAPPPPLPILELVMPLLLFWILHTLCLVHCAVSQYSSSHSNS